MLLLCFVKMGLYRYLCFLSILACFVRTIKKILLVIAFELEILKDLQRILPSVLNLKCGWVCICDSNIMLDVISS